MEFFTGYALGAALANFIWIGVMAEKSRTNYQRYYYHIRNHVRLQRKKKATISCGWCDGSNTWKPAPKGRFGDPEGHKITGKLGGSATAKKMGGSNFYSKIGSKGGSLSGGNFKRDTERAREAGRKGGLHRRWRGHINEL